MIAQNSKNPWVQRSIIAIGIVLAIGLAISIRSLSAADAATRLQLAAGYAAVSLVFLFGVVLLAAMVTGDVDVAQLIGEHGGGASMSRFQLLIFTFVIALGIVYLLGKNSEFPRLSSDVLTLLGISASTYAVSKGIQASSKEGLPPKGEQAEPAQADQGDNQEG